MALEDPAGARKAWSAAWAAPPPAARDDEDPGACRARVELADALLVHEWGHTAGWALVALGGYGRGALLPGSDLDLLLLQGEETDPGHAEEFLRRLWDLGVDVSHAVRTLAGVETSLRTDLASATGTLEGRLIGGDSSLFARLQAKVEAFRVAERERFVAAKLAEADERQRRAGSTVCLLAPDLKRGRGQARDLELARLIAALYEDPSAAPAARREPNRVLPGWRGALERWLGLSASEWGQLASAEETLCAARAGLHRLAPSAGDRLAPELQEDLAGVLGFGEREGRLAVEVAMERIYRAANLVDRLLQRCRLRLAPPLPAPLRQPLAPGISSAGDVAFFTPDPPTDPHLLIEIFELAQRSQRRVSRPALEQVRELGSSLPLDARSAAAFRRILTSGKGAAQTLHDLHQTRLLGRLLPEFGALECLAQADPYHVYTVDEHTLAALRALEGSHVHESEAPRAPEREELLREELFARTPDRDLLRLALLLHDAGKVGGSLGHTERGVTMVRDVARRLELSASEQRHVAFLVGENPTLSLLAERRDVDSPETVAALLEVCGHDPRRLDHLFLLTCADIRGVSPQALTRWKDSLLTRLYERAAAELAGHGVPPSPETPEGWLELLDGQVEPERLREHLELSTQDYLAVVEPGELLLHLELIAELVRDPERLVALRWAPAGGFERVWVASYDRSGLLSELCGALSGAGWDIVGLSAAARRDGVVLDRFAVVPGRSAPPESERPERLRRAIEAVLRKEASAAEMIAARVRREPSPSPLAKTGVRVRLSNEADPDLTLVDVTAPDRVGLLHSLTCVLSATGLDIHLAKVAAKGDRAVAVFHVRSPAGQVSASERDPLLRALARSARGD